MGALERLETFLQDLVERPAGIFLPKRLPPLKIVSALNRELETRALRLADRVVVPNGYDVLLSPDDWIALGDVRHTLESELADYVRRLAVERGLSMRGGPEVRLVQDATIRPGEVHVRATFERGGGEGQPVKQKEIRPPPRSTPPATEQRFASPSLVQIDGEGNEIKRFSIGPQPIKIGRRSSSDIFIDDSKVSRVHARVEGDGSGYYLTDLESTNGTWINGADLQGQHRLVPGDVIQIGVHLFRFES